MKVCGFRYGGLYQTPRSVDHTSVGHPEEAYGILPSSPPPAPPPLALPPKAERLEVIILCDGLEREEGAKGVGIFTEPGDFVCRLLCCRAILNSLLPRYTARSTSQDSLFEAAEDQHSCLQNTGSSSVARDTKKRSSSSKPETLNPKLYSLFFKKKLYSRKSLESPRAGLLCRSPKLQGLVGLRAYGFCRA